MKQEKLDKVIDFIKNSKHCVVFTGAGISVESGIAPFRGEGGTWGKFDPKILELSYFKANPNEAWEMIKSRFVGEDVKPNTAHKVIALMEKEGIIKSIITQNVDNLHQIAGSENVIELHGNAHSLVCMECGDERPLSKEEILGDIRLCSSCGGTLKPNFTFFGENLPVDAITIGHNEALKCDLMILVGTSGEVYPAASLPRIAKDNGAKIIEINPDISNYSITVTDEYIGDKSGGAFWQIGKALNII